MLGTRLDSSDNPLKDLKTICWPKRKLRGYMVLQIGGERGYETIGTQHAVDQFSELDTAVKIKSGPA